MAFIIAGAVRYGAKAVKQGVQAHRDYNDPDRATNVDQWGNPINPGPIYNLVTKANQKMNSKGKERVKSSDLPAEHERTLAPAASGSGSGRGSNPTEVGTGELQRRSSTDKPNYTPAGNYSANVNALEPSMAVSLISFEHWQY
jgi:hypothetical protein